MSIRTGLGPRCTVESLRPAAARYTCTHVRKRNHSRDYRSTLENCVASDPRGWELAAKDRGWLIPSAPVVYNSQGSLARKPSLARSRRHWKRIGGLSGVCLEQMAHWSIELPSDATSIAPATLIAWGWEVWVEENKAIWPAWPSLVFRETFLPCDLARWEEWSRNDRCTSACHSSQLHSTLSCPETSIQHIPASISGRVNSSIMIK